MNENTSTIPIEDIISYEKLLHFHYLVIFLGLAVACLYVAYWMHKNLDKDNELSMGGKGLLVMMTIVWFTPLVVINYFTLLELYVAPEIFIENYSLDSPREQELKALDDMGCVEVQFKIICNGEAQ